MTPASTARKSHTKSRELQNQAADNQIGGSCVQLELLNEKKASRLSAGGPVRSSTNCRSQKNNYKLRQPVTTVCSPSLSLSPHQIHSGFSRSAFDDYTVESDFSVPVNLVIATNSASSPDDWYSESVHGEQTQSKQSVLTAQSEAELAREQAQLARERLVLLKKKNLKKANQEKNHSSLKDRTVEESYSNVSEECCYENPCYTNSNCNEEVNPVNQRGGRGKQRLGGINGYKGRREGQRSKRFCVRSSGRNFDRQNDEKQNDTTIVVDNTKVSFTAARKSYFDARNFSAKVFVTGEQALTRLRDGCHLSSVSVSQSGDESFTNTNSNDTDYDYASRLFTQERFWNWQTARSIERLRFAPQARIAEDPKTQRPAVTVTTSGGGPSAAKRRASTGTSNNNISRRASASSVTGGTASRRTVGSSNSYSNTGRASGATAGRNGGPTAKKQARGSQAAGGGGVNRSAAATKDSLGRSGNKTGPASPSSPRRSSGTVLVPTKRKSAPGTTKRSSQTERPSPKRKVSAVGSKTENAPRLEDIDPYSNPYLDGIGNPGSSVGAASIVPRVGSARPSSNKSSSAKAGSPRGAETGVTRSSFSFQPAERVRSPVGNSPRQSVSSGKAAPARKLSTSKSAAATKFKAKRNEANFSSRSIEDLPFHTTLTIAAIGEQGAAVLQGGDQRAVQTAVRVSQSSSGKEQTGLQRRATTGSIRKVLTKAAARSSTGISSKKACLNNNNSRISTVFQVKDSTGQDPSTGKVVVRKGSRKSLQRKYIENTIGTWHAAAQEDDGDVIQLDENKSTVIITDTTSKKIAVKSENKFSGSDSKFLQPLSKSVPSETCEERETPINPADTNSEDAELARLQAENLRAYEGALQWGSLVRGSRGSDSEGECSSLAKKPAQKKTSSSAKKRKPGLRFSSTLSSAVAQKKSEETRQNRKRSGSQTKQGEQKKSAQDSEEESDSDSHTRDDSSNVVGDDSSKGTTYSGEGGSFFQEKNFRRRARRKKSNDAKRVVPKVTWPVDSEEEKTCEEKTGEESEKVKGLNNTQDQDRAVGARETSEQASISHQALQALLELDTSDNNKSPEKTSAATTNEVELHSDTLDRTSDCLLGPPPAKLLEVGHRSCQGVSARRIKYGSESHVRGEVPAKTSLLLGSTLSSREVCGGTVHLVPSSGVVVQEGGSKYYWSNTDCSSTAGGHSARIVSQSGSADFFKVASDAPQVSDSGRMSPARKAATDASPKGSGKLWMQEPSLLVVESAKGGSEFKNLRPADMKVGRERNAFNDNMLSPRAKFVPSTRRATGTRGSQGINKTGGSTDQQHDSNHCESLSRKIKNGSQSPSDRKKADRVVREMMLKEECLTDSDSVTAKPKSSASGNKKGSRENNQSMTASQKTGTTGSVREGGTSCKTQRILLSMPQMVPITMPSVLPATSGRPGDIGLNRFADIKLDASLMPKLGEAPKLLDLPLDSELDTDKLKASGNAIGNAEKPKAETPSGDDNAEVMKTPIATSAPPEEFVTPSSGGPTDRAPETAPATVTSAATQPTSNVAVLPVSKEIIPPTPEVPELPASFPDFSPDTLERISGDIVVEAMHGAPVGSKKRSEKSSRRNSNSPKKGDPPEAVIEINESKIPEEKIIASTEEIGKLFTDVKQYRQSPVVLREEGGDWDLTHTNSPGPEQPVAAVANNQCHDAVPAVVDSDVTMPAEGSLVLKAKANRYKPPKSASNVFSRLAGDNAQEACTGDRYDKHKTAHLVGYDEARQKMRRQQGRGGGQEKDDSKPKDVKKEGLECQPVGDSKKLLNSRKTADSAPQRQGNTKGRAVTVTGQKSRQSNAPVAVTSSTAGKLMEGSVNQLDSSQGSSAEEITSRTYTNSSGPPGELATGDSETAELSGTSATTAIGTVLTDTGTDVEFSDRPKNAADALLHMDPKDWEPKQFQMVLRQSESPQRQTPAHLHRMLDASAEWDSMRGQRLEKLRQLKLLKEREACVPLKDRVAKAVRRELQKKLSSAPLGNRQQKPPTVGKPATVVGGQPISSKKSPSRVRSPSRQHPAALAPSSPRKDLVVSPKKKSGAAAQKTSKSKKEVDNANANNAENSSDDKDSESESDSESDSETGDDSGPQEAEKTGGHVFHRLQSNVQDYYYGPGAGARESDPEPTEEKRRGQKKRSEKSKKKKKKNRKEDDVSEKSKVQGAKELETEGEEEQQLKLENLFGEKPRRSSKTAELLSAEHMDALREELLELGDMGSIDGVDVLEWVAARERNEEILKHKNYKSPTKHYKEHSDEYWQKRSQPVSGLMGEQAGAFWNSRSKGPTMSQRVKASSKEEATAAPGRRSKSLRQKAEKANKKSRKSTDRDRKGSGGCNSTKKGVKAERKRTSKEPTEESSSASQSESSSESGSSDDSENSSTEGSDADAQTKKSKRKTRERAKLKRRKSAEAGKDARLGSPGAAGKSLSLEEKVALIQQHLQDMQDSRRIRGGSKGSPRENLAVFHRLYSAKTAKDEIRELAKREELERRFRASLAGDLQNDEPGSRKSLQQIYEEGLKTHLQRKKQTPQQPWSSAQRNPLRTSVVNNAARTSTTQQRTRTRSGSLQNRSTKLDEEGGNNLKLEDSPRLSRESSRKKGRRSRATTAVAQGQRHWSETHQEDVRPRMSEKSRKLAQNPLTAAGDQRPIWERPTHSSKTKGLSENKNATSGEDPAGSAMRGAGVPAQESVKEANDPAQEGADDGDADLSARAKESATQESQQLDKNHAEARARARIAQKQDLFTGEDEKKQSPSPVSSSRSPSPRALSSQGLHRPKGYVNPNLKIGESGSPILFERFAAQFQTPASTASKSSAAKKRRSSSASPDSPHVRSAAFVDSLRRKMPPSSTEEEIDMQKLVENHVDREAGRSSKQKGSNLTMYDSSQASLIFSPREEKALRKHVVGTGKSSAEMQAL